MRFFFNVWFLPTFRMVDHANISWVGGLDEFLDTNSFYFLGGEMGSKPWDERLLQEACDFAGDLVGTCEMSPNSGTTSLFTVWQTGSLARFNIPCENLSRLRFSILNRRIFCLVTASHWGIFLAQKEVNDSTYQTLLQIGCLNLKSGAMKVAFFERVYESQNVFWNPHPLRIV